MENQLKDLLPTQPMLPNPEKYSDSFDRVSADDIELSEEEIKSALMKVKLQKAARMNEQRYWDKVKQPVVYPELSAEQLGKIIKQYAESFIPGFVLDEFNKPIFKLLCQYFTKDPEFEAQGYSLRKGILLFGNIGCGKTTMMRLFEKNTTNDYIVHSCRKVAGDYSKSGVNALEYYSSLVDVYQHEHYGQKYAGMCFDDLGTERNKKHFGNDLNVMEDIFQNRYDNKLITKTHLTTNLDENEMGAYYGPRVRSRLREMCNIISFAPESQDRRK